VLQAPEISPSQVGCLGVYGSKKQLDAPSIVPAKKNMVLAMSESLNRESILENRNEFSMSADAIIWVGDLNYRINGVVGAVLFSMKKNMFDVLLDNDQLSIERKIGRIGENMLEGPILFAPTYKMTSGQDTYNVSARIPGWTDRVLFASNNGCLN